MSKKFLLILISLFMFAGTAFAYSSPRWFTMPVSVYIPKQPEGIIVKNAFWAWQVGTKSCVRFLFKTSPNLAAISSVNVIFTDSLPNNKSYVVEHRFSQFGGSRSSANNFYNYSDVLIATKDASGASIPAGKLSAIAMQAVGRLIGLPFSSDENSIMYENSDFSDTSLTSDAIESVYRIYKPNYKSKE